MSEKLGKEEQQKIIDKAMEIFDNNIYIEQFGMEIDVVEPKFLRVKVPMDEKILNLYGTIHGGALYSVADVVAGTLACFGGKYCTTLEGNLNYLRPAKSENFIYCDAKILRSGGHVVVVRVKIRDEHEKLLDEGSFTFYKTDVDIV